MKSYARKISTRLFNKFYLLISFIILISIAGLLCIQLLKTTSSEIVFEYMELDAVHNLQNSFHETFLPAYHYLIYKDSNELDKFNEKMLESKNQLAYCKQFLRKSHNTDFLVYFNNYLAQFEHIVVHSGKNDFNISSNKKLIDRLQQMLKQANLKIESLKLETKHEIDIHIKTNTTSATHSSVTIILLTLSITLIGIYQVNILVAKLTTPLNELVNSTKIIGAGNLSVRTAINTQDEFEILGNSFNSMVAELENSTISINYFNNILSSMYDSLIVTDRNGNITLVNQATCKLLGYENEFFQNKHISFLLFDGDKKPMNLNFDDLQKKISISNIEKKYQDKAGEFIPVLFSCSALKDNANNLSGIVFVAHDIRERKRMYHQLENIRKLHLIDINEAQEKERLRIAGDIHDGLGQILTGISYYIESNMHNSNMSKEELDTHTSTIQNHLTQAISESKNIAFDLIPILLKDFGLVVAIENLMDHINKQHQLKFTFKTFNFNKRLDEKLEKMLYRFIQEASSNIIKHAEAQHALIHIVGHENSVSIAINDDGKGFDYPATIKDTKGRGIGLISMKERVLSYSGMFSIDSELNSGTEILIEIPLN